MSWWIWLLLAVAVVLFVWGAVSPRSQWWAMQAWALKNPDANEPSETAYALTRLTYVVALIALAVTIFVLATLP